MNKIHLFHEVYDSQKLFRLLLDAVANPAREVCIGAFAEKMFGEAPAFLAAAMTLLDNEVSFWCADEALTGEIVSLTLSKPEAIENADYIFISKPSMLQQCIEQAKCGTLKDPHKSATIIVKADEPCDRYVSFSGPGIGGEAVLNTCETVRTALTLRDRQNYEYPQGVDFIFMTSGGSLFAVPRLLRWEVR
jgi:alpha-D-ribose 1-methylphosphonate 5-triphosphate synthase subunit PhnH